MLVTKAAVVSLSVLILDLMLLDSSYFVLLRKLHCKNGKYCMACNNIPIEGFSAQLFKLWCSSLVEHFTYDSVDSLQVSYPNVISR